MSRGPVERLREMLAGCRRCAVFTGAGIGTEIIDASGDGAGKPRVLTAAPNHLPARLP